MSFSEKLFELFTPSSSSSESIEHDPGIVELIMKRKSEVSQLVQLTTHVTQAAVDMGRVAHAEKQPEAQPLTSDISINTAPNTSQPVLNFAAPSLALTDAERRAQQAMQQIHSIQQDVVKIEDFSQAVDY